MPCKWDRKPCLKQGCSEWDCAGLRKPEDCRHWEPSESCGACTEVGIHPAKHAQPNGFDLATFAPESSRQGSLTAQLVSPAYNFEAPMTPELKLLLAEFGNANYDYALAEPHTPEAKEGFECIAKAQEAIATHIQGRMIVPGPFLFEFTSFDHWADTAQIQFRQVQHSSDDTICLDARGRTCWCGKDFMQAQAEGTFPVRVFSLVR